MNSATCSVTTGQTFTCKPTYVLATGMCSLCPAGQYPTGASTCGVCLAVGAATCGAATGLKPLTCVPGRILTSTGCVLCTGKTWAATLYACRVCPDPTASACNVATGVTTACPSGFGQATSTSNCTSPPAGTYANNGTFLPCSRCCHLRRCHWIEGAYLSSGPGNQSKCMFPLWRSDLGANCNYLRCMSRCQRGFLQFGHRDYNHLIVNLFY